MNDIVGIRLLYVVSGLFAVADSAHDGDIAVSYTHLDVYKRQALEHVNFNGGLTVSCSGVNLALLYRNCGVSVDDTVEYAAESFNTE